LITLRHYAIDIAPLAAIAAADIFMFYLLIILPLLIAA
jgi:hypothetical protein